MAFVHLHRHSDKPCVLAGPSGSYVGSAAYRRHRQVWIAANGPIPDGYVIHHACLEKACVELSHLECITDAEHRRIHLKLRPRGQRTGPNTPEWRARLSAATKRLTDAQVRQVRSLRETGLTYDRIAAEVGCSSSTAYNIVSGKHYSEVV